MRRAVVFGDALAADPAAGLLGFARVLPLLLGCRGAVLGRPGPGFVKLPIDERRPYSSRLPELLASGADIAVVQVSGNDARAEQAAVRVAAEQFLSAVREGLPTTYVLGPLWTPYETAKLPALRDIIADVCRRVGLPFIDGLGWLSPGLLASDGEHPTRRGHLRIAGRAARAIRVVSRVSG